MRLEDGQKLVNITKTAKEEEEEIDAENEGEEPSEGVNEEI
jgi:hypothetical protein